MCYILVEKRECSPPSDFVDIGEYSLNSDEWDIYELSDSLKLFLRELKEPLLLYALYDDFSEFAFPYSLVSHCKEGGCEIALFFYLQEDFSSTMASDSVDQNVSKMRHILKKLPECHYATAKLIFEHLNK